MPIEIMGPGSFRFRPPTEEEARRTCPQDYQGPLFLYGASETLAEAAINAVQSPRFYERDFWSRDRVIAVFFLLLFLPAMAYAITGFVEERLWSFMWWLRFTIGIMLVIALFVGWSIFAWSSADSDRWVHPAAVHFGVLPITPFDEWIPFVRWETPFQWMIPSTLLAGVQMVLTDRIGLWLAGLAAESSMAHETSTVVATKGKLDPNAEKLLLDSLGLMRPKADRLIDIMLDELAHAQESGVVAGSWGEMRGDKRELFLQLIHTAPDSPHIAT